MKKDDMDEIKKIMRELLSEVKQEQGSPVEVEKDSKGRRKRPKKKDKGYFFYCNKADLKEFSKICWDSDKSVGEVLREKVYQVLKDAGVIPEDRAKT